MIRRSLVFSAAPMYGTVLRTTPTIFIIGNGRLPDATDIIYALPYTKSTSCDFCLNSSYTPHLGAPAC
jgi:hypothetical protein